MDVHNKRMFRVLACCELMTTDHWYVAREHGQPVRRFVEGGRLRFLTLTVSEKHLPLPEVARRFRNFANTRWWRGLMRHHSYVAVYEPHPCGHGWHIHILTNVFIPWQKLQLMANAHMFGSTNIEAAETTCSFYIAKYVTKAQVLKRAEESRHVRIVNVSRDLLPLRDIEVHSPSVDYIRRLWKFTNIHNPYMRLKSLYFRWVYSWSAYDFITELLVGEIPF